MSDMVESYDSRTLGRRVHELLVLGTLRGGPLHGYQIALEVEERSEGFFAFNHGTLYPILHHLESEGLIVGEWSDGEGRARKEYAVTDAGRSHLENAVRHWRTLERKLARFLMDEATDEQVRTSAA